MTFNNPIIGGNGQLVRNNMHSENYVPDTSGWQITRDGDAEFNSVVVRGELDVRGTDGSYVRAVAQGGHADLMLNPETVPGLTWVPGLVTADVDPAGVGTDIPALTIRSPAGAGLSEPAAEIYMIGPGELDQNALAFRANSIDFGPGTSPTATTVNIDGTLFTGDTEIDGDLNITGNATNDTLNAVTFKNGWGNFGGTFEHVCYVSYADGTAGVVGVASGGTVASGTAIFTLPLAYRPRADHTFECTGNTLHRTQVVVQTSGDVQLQIPEAGLTWVSLSNLRWPKKTVYP